MYDINGNVIEENKSSSVATSSADLLRLFRTMCVIGDSISSGTICTPRIERVRYDWSWLSIICRKYGITGLNLARGGASALDWADTFRSKWADTTVQDAYVIALGTNDINHTLGNENSTDTTTFGGSYKAIIDKIIEKSPKSAIFLASPYNTTVSASVEINRIIRQIAKQYDNCFYINVSGKVADSYWSNGHPDTLGNLYLANAFESEIEKVVVNNLNFFKDFGANQTGQGVNPVLGW